MPAQSPFWTSCRPTRSASPSPTGPSSRPRSPRTRPDDPKRAHGELLGVRERCPRGGAEVARGPASKDGRERVSARPNAKPGAGREPRRRGGGKPAARRPRSAPLAAPRATWSRTQDKSVATKCGPGRNLTSRCQFFSRNGRRCLFPLAAACAPYRVARATDAYRGGFSREGERIDHPAKRRGSAWCRSNGASRRLRVLFGGGDGSVCELPQSRVRRRSTHQTRPFSAPRCPAPRHPRGLRRRLQRYEAVSDVANT